jgi:hypothetical protein
VVVGIGNVNVTDTVHSHRVGGIQTVASVTGCTGSSHPAEGTRKADLADSVVVGIGNVNVTDTVHSHATGVVQLGFGGEVDGD